MTSPIPQPLRLAPSVRAAIVAAARAALPRELVGLLATAANGAVDGVTHWQPLSNTAAGNDRFAVEPIAFAAAESELRQRGLQFCGFVHSHPDGPAWPSATDRRELWPDCLHLIVGVPRAAPATLAAFCHRDGDLEPVPLAPPHAAAEHAGPCTTPEQTRR